ncbi:hypothetical protein BAE44_0002479 [Dichanthelium oligosanthes]|uniref:Uncharacterized protein n=1 Tax=Dichanthelium oligosanthes TaxID=888268 RepID=A0A1E5WGL2_9POAL|nr:hypothetical protein BAE44_0002479 [Dichanthelium oligosanthes]
MSGREMEDSGASIQEEASAALDGTSGTHSNLRCFLDSVTPIVKAHRVPKAPHLPPSNDYHGNIADNNGVKCFYLADLWNLFYQWSACGVGTSVCIAPGETMEQYFVPYLSAIELYTNEANVPASQSSHGWQNDCNMVYDRRFNEYNQHGAVDWTHGYQTPSQVSKSGVESRGELVFKYFEPDSPYERVPFVDQVYKLYNKCPSLSSLSSVELSPSSWMSVFWYPTSHVLPAKNQKDLNTCFLTYHSLSTSEDNVALDSVHASDHVVLAPFGLATYKLDAKVWASPNSGDQEHIASLLNAARSWLKKHNIHHHDFSYFSYRCSST